MPAPKRRRTKVKTVIDRLAIELPKADKIQVVAQLSLRYDRKYCDFARVMVYAVLRKSNITIDGRPLAEVMRDAK